MSETRAERIAPDLRVIGEAKMIKILNRFSGELLLEIESLSGADLREANRHNSGRGVL